MVGLVRRDILTTSCLLAFSLASKRQSNCQTTLFKAANEAQKGFRLLLLLLLLLLRRRQVKAKTNRRHSSQTSSVIDTNVGLD